MSKIWIDDEVLIDYDSDNDNNLLANVLLSATDDVYDNMLKLTDFYTSNNIENFDKLLFDNDGIVNIYIDITEDMTIKKVGVDVDYCEPNHHNPSGTINENYYKNIKDKIAEEDLNKLQKVVISEAEKYLKHSLQEEFKEFRQEVKQNMITSAAVEHFDNFDNSICFWVDVVGVSEKLISQAKQIDKENFNEECFGCCVVLDKDGWNVIHDETPDKEIYYVDNNGEKHWFNTKLEDKEKRIVIDTCVSALCENIIGG